MERARSLRRRDTPNQAEMAVRVGADATASPYEDAVVESVAQATGGPGVPFALLIS